jgi:hypothetical protein
MKEAHALFTWMDTGFWNKDEKTMFYNMSCIPKSSLLRICMFDGGHSMDSYFECTHNEYGQLLKDGGNISLNQKAMTNK